MSARGTAALVGMTEAILGFVLIVLPLEANSVLVMEEMSPVLCPSGQPPISAGKCPSVVPFLFSGPTPSVRKLQYHRLVLLPFRRKLPSIAQRKPLLTPPGWLSHRDARYRE